MQQRRDTRKMKEVALVFLETAPFVFTPEQRRVTFTWICGLFFRESYSFLKNVCFSSGWNSSGHKWEESIIREITST